MRKQWSPEIITKRLIEIEDEVYKQRLEEMAEIFYDAFCELHKTCSIEPELTDLCGKQSLRKAG
jgi:hypothetical protein